MHFFLIAFCWVFDALSILPGSSTESFSDAGWQSGKSFFVLQKFSFRPVAVMGRSAFCLSAIFISSYSSLNLISSRLNLFFFTCDPLLILISSSSNSLPALHLCQPMTLRALYVFCIGRVQERKKSDLYPYRARKMVEVGYRRKKMVICTLKRREKWQKPGTGEEKWSSVP